MSKVGTVSDIDGNSYDIVKIGNQYWFASNLRTTKKTDGTLISSTHCKTINESNAWYTGRHYSHLIVSEGRIAPTGCVVPEVGAWTSLIHYIGGYENAAKLKAETLGGTDDYGFKAIYAGYYYGSFVYTNSEGWYWCPRDFHVLGAVYALYALIKDGSNKIIVGETKPTNFLATKRRLFSVRCMVEDPNVITWDSGITVPDKITDYGPDPIFHGGGL